VRFGLLALKNVGRAFLQAVVDERNKVGAYRSFDDFLDRLSSADLNRRQIESLIKAGAFDTLGIYRTRLLAVCEQMLEKVQSRNRANLTGQLDMFSVAGTERPSIEYPELPEFGHRELLMQEKEAAGMYFSGHLLDGFSKALSAPDITEIRTLAPGKADEESEIPDRARVTVAGIITAIVGKTTKKEERMAFFTLEDRLGEIECIAFPKVLAEFGHALHADNVIKVEGTLSVREEENPKILVTRITELADNEHFTEPSQKEPALTAQKAQEKPAIAPERAKVLYLRVPKLDSEAWRRAKNLLEIFEGALPVSVYDAESKTYHKQSLGFDCTAYTVRELKKLLGEENVVLK
jgi:DNA polymerase-3 subunit alpha